MTTTWVPGYSGTITIDTEDYTIYGNVLGMSMSKTTPRKPTFGQKHSGVISGQQSWSLTASGHIAAEGPLAELIDAADSATALAYSVQIGAAAGSDDAGAFAGDLVISGLDISADAEGEWDWSLSAEIDGANAFTAPTP